MFKKIENLAWLILILSFLGCITLTIGTPLTLRWYILNAMQPLKLTLQPRNGTISLQKPGNNLPNLISETVEVTPRDHIVLQSNADALLFFYQQNQPETLPFITVQLYGPADITIKNARTPRFTLSALPHHATLTVVYGPNLRFTIDGNGRAAVVTVQTPHGSVEMYEGAYAVAVTAERTVFSVRSGQGRVPRPGAEETFILTDLQRIELTADNIGEVSAGERNVLYNQNGNFETPLTETWQEYNIVGMVNESEGTIEQVQFHEDQQIITFKRVGLGFAETGIIQEINQDLRGAQSVRVRARVRIDAHSLGTCGSYASECPIMLRIGFVDDNNTEREWLQGFYAVRGDDQPICQSCEWQARQIQVPQLGVWYDYESSDLLPLLREKGITPVAIRSVKIYASGHTYSSAIDEIAILISE
ncbi:MAG: hypothetical protein JXA33_13540 [Anaerolineae bacterium]|nr:hypothetical protein [Anaerolineae bacterium]